MTEDWGDLESLPPPKAGAPRWLWFCGGGCLLLALGLFAIGTWGYTWVKEGLDPEIQWPKVAQVLPYDERPEDFELKFGGQIPGLEFYAFVYKDMQTIAALVVQSNEKGEFDARLEFGEDVVLFEQGELEIQGRTVPLTRIQVEGESARMPWHDRGFDPDVQQLSMLQLDLTEPGTERGIVALFTREDDQFPSEELVREFLRPFHVGPDREPSERDR